MMTLSTASILVKSVPVRRLLQLEKPPHVSGLSLNLAVIGVNLLVVCRPPDDRFFAKVEIALNRRGSPVDVGAVHP